MKKQVIKPIIEMILVVVITALVFHYILLPIKIDGDSMYPTLHDGDYAMVSALKLDKSDIKRFDVVIIDCKQLDKNIVKRVIGLPGETIVYKNDKLYVDGVYFEEPFLDSQYIKEAKKQDSSQYFTQDFEVKVKENEIYVLGDNRLKSADSRTFGAFQYNDLIGKRGLVIFPFKNMEWMD